jgi:uncharacterized protein with GYD domain
MSKYLFTASYSVNGAKGLLSEGGSGRKAMFGKMIADLGGNMEAFYYGFGADDLYIIADLPDDASATALALNVGSAGAIGIRTTVLVTPETVDEAAGKSVNYRAPGA